MSAPKQKSICEIASRLNAATASLRWLDEIDQRAAYYLEVDPDRAGAAMLACARNNVDLARRAIEARSADGAAYAAMAALQAAWQAEMTEGRRMLDAGVTAYRKAEAENAKRREAATRDRENWQRQAEEIRRESARKLTKTEIAKRIDPARASTIRRYI